MAVSGVLSSCQCDRVPTALCALPVYTFLLRHAVSCVKFACDGRKPFLSFHNTVITLVFPVPFGLEHLALGHLIDVSYKSRTLQDRTTNDPTSFGLSAVGWVRCPLRFVYISFSSNCFTRVVSTYRPFSPSCCHSSLRTHVSISSVIYCHFSSPPGSRPFLYESHERFQPCAYRPVGCCPNVLCVVVRFVLVLLFTLYIAGHVCRIR